MSLSLAHFLNVSQRIDISRILECKIFEASGRPNVCLTSCLGRLTQVYRSGADILVYKSGLD